MPEKKKKERKIVLLMFFFTIVFVLIGNKEEEDRFGMLTPLEEGWMMDGEELSTPFDFYTEKGGVYSIMNVLPSAFEEEMAIVFKSENIFWKVFVDGEEIASYQKEDVTVGLTPGDSWNVVSIPEGTNGKTIEIQMTIVFETGSNLLRVIHYAPANIAMQETAMQGILGFVICIMIFVISMFYIVTDLLIFHKQTGGYVLVTWALFSTSMALWSLSQISIIHMLIGNGALIRILSYATLPCVLASAIIFVTRKMCRGKQVIARILAGISVFWGIAVVLLDIFEVVSFVETVTYTQYMLIIFMTAVIIQSLVNFRDYKSKTFRQKIYMFGNIALLFSAAWDLYRVFNLGAEDYSRNTRVALLIYSLLLVLIFLWNSLNM